MPEGRSVPAACSDTSAHAQVMLRVVIWAAVWSSAAACGNLNITKPTAYLNAMADNLPKDYCIKSAGHVSPAHGALDARCVLEAWFSSALDTLQELMGNLEMSGRLYRDVKGLYDFTNQFLRQCVSDDNYSCPNGVPLEVITPKHFCSLTLKAFQAALHLSGRPGSVSTRELAPWLPVTPAARHGEACACSQAQLLECCAADSPQPPTVTARSTAGAPGEATGPVTSDQTDARVAGLGDGASVGPARGAAGRAVRGARRRPLEEAAVPPGPTPTPRRGAVPVSHAPRPPVGTVAPRGGT